jgi:hypothetical protein
MRGVVLLVFYRDLAGITVCLQTASRYEQKNIDDLNFKLSSWNARLPNDLK